MKLINNNCRLLNNQKKLKALIAELKIEKFNIVNNKG